MIKVAINGFGRIGRAVLRARFKYPEFNQICIPFLLIDQIS